MSTLSGIPKLKLPHFIKPVSALEPKRVAKKVTVPTRSSGGFSVSRNQVLTVVAVVVVGAIAYFGAYYFARNANTRKELTPEEKNMAEELDKMNNDTSNQNPFQPADQQASGEAGTYTVKPGESLSMIAATYTGDGDRYTELAQANGINNPNHIEPGQTLTIPAGFTKKTETTGQNQSQSPNPNAQQTSATYTVVRNDTLWSLAQRYYGSGFEWYKIRDANTDKVKTLVNGKPWIEVGVQLTIPLAAASSLQ